MPGFWLFLHYQCVSVFSVLVDLVRELNASFSSHKLLHMGSNKTKSTWKHEYVERVGCLAHTSITNCFLKLHLKLHTQFMKTIELASAGKGNMAGSVNEVLTVRVEVTTQQLQLLRLVTTCKWGRVKRKNETQLWELILAEDNM